MFENPWEQPQPNDQLEIQKLIDKLLSGRGATQTQMRQAPAGVVPAQRQQGAGTQASPYAGFVKPLASLGNDIFGGGSSGGSSGSSSLPLGYILAAVKAQHMASSDTDRRTNSGGKASSSSGHRTGDIFSGDMFTEPWMAWGEQKLGVKNPTSGEKTDAAIDRMQDGKGGFSDLGSTVPGTAYQWFDPVGNFVDDILSDKFGKGGKVASSILMPHTGLKRIADLIGGLF